MVVLQKDENELVAGTPQKDSHVCCFTQKDSHVCCFREHFREHRQSTMSLLLARALPLPHHLLPE